MSGKKYYDKVQFSRETDRLLIHEDDNITQYDVTPVSDDERRSNTRTLLVTLCILVTEMCERLTYYSIVANLVLYCTSTLDIGQTDATNINQVFTGFVYLIAIFGGFISDSYAGRFNTILGSSVLYIIGVLLLPASAFDYENWGWGSLSVDIAVNISSFQLIVDFLARLRSVVCHCFLSDRLTYPGAKTGLFMTGLVFVAVGTGGIKANVGPFGAEQVGSLGKEAVQSFFNWFYWVVNVGAFIAYAFVSYIQQNVSFAWGFFVPLCSMVVAVSIFISVRPEYVRTHPKGSVLATAWKVCAQGTCKAPRKSKIPEGAKVSILARAKKTYGGDYEDHIVDGIVSVVKVTPFCLLVIMYWAINSQDIAVNTSIFQLYVDFLARLRSVVCHCFLSGRLTYPMSNTFFAQSERMDVRLGGGINIPAAALNIFNTISIIILIPIVDRFVYPFFERIGRPLTYLKRMGIGMVLAVLAVLVAGVVEIYRKEGLDNSHVQELAGQKFNSSSMSVFVQIPQFALIGASEIFTSVTTLEFAYNQAPVPMQGLLTGLFLAASGVGSWVSTAILSIVQSATEEHPWWCDEINQCHMENLMFLLGGLMFVNFLAFCLISHFYTYQDPASFEQTYLVENGNVTSLGEEDSSKVINLKNPSSVRDGSLEEPKGRRQKASAS